ncbi:uncharacterized protein LOC135343224 [Halichondria panicea]|uniref:uncharacterized protein LOC135343224 n=1 Tax=Halichondria panicea TaxID=6063 RepID=UPI00312B435E
MAIVTSLWLIRVLPVLMAMWMVNSHNGVSIRFMGVELTRGISRVCLSDIGEQLPGAKAMVGVPDTVEGPALVCVTNNPNCCRSVDNPNGGGVGDWTINGFSAPGMYANPQSRIYRNRGTGLVRINYQPSTEGADPPLVLIGQYCCTIPDMSGVFQTLCIEVNNAVCNTSTMPLPTATSTATVTGFTDIVPPTTDPPPGSSDPQLGAIVGPLVGVIVVLILIIVIVMVTCTSRRKKRNGQSEGNIPTNDLTNRFSAIDSENIDLKTNQAYGNIKHGKAAVTVANLVANPSYESVPPPIAQQSVEYDYIPDLLHGNTPASNSGDGTKDSNSGPTSLVYEEIHA